MKWLVAVGLVLGVLVIGGVFVVRSLDLSGIMGGPCFCGDAGPSWSPDGRLIVYTHNERNKDSHLYVIKPQGGKPERLTGHGDDSSPVWSPDGSTIAFVHGEKDPSSQTCDLNGENCKRYYIQVLSSGNGARRLAESDEGGFLQWSPDGTRIAYTDADSDLLHAVRADGTSDLTFDLGSSAGASITPDGFDWSGSHSLVYSSDGQIYFVTADSRVRWKDFKSRTVEFVDWSPHGNKLAFVNAKGLFVMNVDGSRPRRLGGTSSSESAWSPDGTRLAWTEDGTIVVANSDGSRRRKLVVKGAYSPGSPTWSPDGTRLVFSAEPAQGAKEGLDDDETKLFIVPLAQPGRIRRLT